MNSKLIVNVGGMYSGKSTELQRQAKRHLIAGHSIVIIKPNIDNRYSEDCVVTHDGNQVEAICLDAKASILDCVARQIMRTGEVKAVLIDEIQFFNDRIIKDILKLLEKNITVYVSGLDMDFRGVPFEVMSNLMAMADEVHKLHAVCERCGEDALFSAKLTASESVIEIGEKDTYIALCRKCFMEHRKKNPKKHPFEDVFVFFR